MVVDGEHNICFYSDYGQISGIYPIWVQAELKKMVRMFESVVLQMNLNKTKKRICTPGFIWGQLGAEAYKQ